MSLEGANKAHTALVIDDEPGIREALAGVLSDEGWQVVLAKNGREGLLKLRQKQVQVVFLDICMPGLDGISVLQSIKDQGLHVPVVIMSGHGTIETAVKATKLGAFDYLEKPLSIDKLLPLLAQATAVNQMGDKVISSGFSSLVGESPAIEQIRRQIDRVAPKNTWALISGENGTGKEVVARLLHAGSSRSQKPFVAVNCAAIPDELIESELFGHVKGAFTNAFQHKKGRFEVANGGTLFLDEIADMSLRAQAKVLRILQEQSFERLGGTELIQVDVRVIAATNKDLAQEMKAGRFREDLFYRLNVIPFELPPLRERGSDIALLAGHFLRHVATELGESTKTLDAEVQKLLGVYNWPGNVRELKNVMERLSVMALGTEIKKADLLMALPVLSELMGSPAFAISEAASLKEAKIEFERSFILERLVENDWNVSRTAESIGIERTHLHRKIKAFKIDSKK